MAIQSLQNDEDIRMWNVEKSILLRQQERGEISNTEFIEKYNRLQSLIIEKNKTTLEALNAELIKNEEKWRTETMDIEPKKKEKVVGEVKSKGVKGPRGPKKDSAAGFIIEALEMKSIKTVDQVADRVLQRKPDRDRTKLKTQISVMINEFKKGKKPQYKWNEEEFQLTKIL